MKKILMIDANVPFRKALAEIIECRLPSVSIEGQSDGMAGLAEARSYRPDLVFVDIDLPGKGGLETARRIKELDLGVVIIAFTSYDLPEYLQAIRQSGIDHLVPKDAWTGEEMLALVESILSPGRQTEGRIKPNGEDGE